MESWEGLRAYKAKGLQKVSKNLAGWTEAYVRSELLRILSPVVTNKRVKFSDYMGSVDVAISLRSGKQIIVSSNDAYYYKKRGGPASFVSHPWKKLAF